MDIEEKENLKLFLKDFEKDLDRDIKKREKSIKSKVKILEKANPSKSLIDKPTIYKVLKNATEEINDMDFKKLSRSELERVERLLLWMRDISNILDADNSNNLNLTKLSKIGIPQTISGEYKVNLIEDIGIKINRKKGIIYRKT